MIFIKPHSHTWPAILCRTANYVAGLATGLCWLVLAAPAQAQVFVDQAFVPSLLGGAGAPFIRTDQSFAQTFTVSKYGQLAKVDVQIYKAAGTTGNPVILEVRMTSNGIPDADNAGVLVSKVIQLSSIPDRTFLFPAPLTSVDVSDADIIVSPGDVLAVSLRREADQFPFGVFWQSSAQQTYLDGRPFTRDDQVEPWGPPPNDDDLGFQTFMTFIDLLSVTIDIKPGDERNVINPRSKGGVWVAILSDTHTGSPFDPSSQVDVPTVEFGPDGAKAIRHKVKDINKDGLGDLLLRFSIPETGIACGDTEATLTGQTFEGVSFTGTDSINTVGCRPKNCHKKHHHEKHDGKYHDDDCDDDEKHHGRHKEKGHHERHYSKHHDDDRDDDHQKR